MAGWLFLTTAILLEIAGTTAMKLSDGFVRLTPSTLIFVFYALSFSALTLALKYIDVGVAYAIWAGVGTVLIATIGIFYFNEPISFLKMLSVALIIMGVVGLNLSGGSH